jgi:RNA-directed DNA polymerase
MQEPYVKGVAHHHGPESCVARREARGEALTGESAGQPLSSEIEYSGAPTLLYGGEGHTGGDAKREPSPGPAESKTLCMRGHPTHENRERPPASVNPQPTDRSGKAIGRKPDAHAGGQSDIGIVPMKASNKAAPWRRRRRGREGR